MVDKAVVCGGVLSHEILHSSVVILSLPSLHLQNNKNIT